MADLVALLLIVVAVTAVATVLRAILRPLERIALAAWGGAVAVAQGRKQKAAAKSPFLCKLSAEELNRALLAAGQAPKPVKRTLQERAPVASVSSTPAEPKRSQQGVGSVAENDAEPWHAPWPEAAWKEEKPDIPAGIRNHLALVESAAVGLCEISRLLSYDEERRAYVDTVDGYAYTTPIDRHDLMAAQAVIGQVLRENLETMRTHCDWSRVQGDIRFT